MPQGLSNKNPVYPARQQTGLGGVHKLTSSLDPLSFLQLVRLVIMRQGNGVPILVTQDPSGVTHVGHGEVFIR